MPDRTCHTEFKIVEVDIPPPQGQDLADAKPGPSIQQSQSSFPNLQFAEQALNFGKFEDIRNALALRAVISLNQLLDRWLTIVVKARVRVRTFRDYETLLLLHIRPVLGSRLIGTICQVDLESLYARMFERGLSARTIEYTNAVLESAFRRAVSWKMLAERILVSVSICHE